MGKINIELFERLRNRFARMRHPKHFRMEQIAVRTDCGAAMCFVGHTLVLEGYKMRLKPKEAREFVDKFDAADASRSDYEFIRPDGSVVFDPVSEAAKRLKIDVYPEGQSLFEAYHIRTPKQAVARLNRIIKTGKVLE